MQKYFVLNMNVSFSVISELNRFGEVILIKHHKGLATPVCCHADCQITSVDNQTLVYAPGMSEDTLSELEKTGIRLIRGNTELSPIYPGNIAYNVLKVGKNIYHNMKYTDSVVKKLFEEREYSFANIKQGYAGCSSVYAKDILLTNDDGIKSTADKNNVDCFKFNGYDIILKGYDRGFIGGSCGYDEDLGLLITGKMSLLKEGYELSRVLYEHGIRVTELSDDVPEDIGGIQIYKV